MRVVTEAGLAAALAASSLLLPEQLPCLGPAPRTVEEYKKREAVEGLIKRYWSTGLKTSDDDEKVLARASGEFGSTYGEVSFDGGRSIFASLELKAGDIFADLGSGVAKLAVQAYLETQVDAVLAIELSTERDRRARSSWDRCVHSGEAAKIKGETFDPSALHFLCADIIDAPFDDLQVTHCFCANLCFSEDMNRKLTEKIARSSSICRIATLVPLSTCSRIKPAGTIRAAMSWNHAGGGSDVHLYEKRRA